VGQSGGELWCTVDARGVSGAIGNSVVSVCYPEQTRYSGAEDSGWEQQPVLCWRGREERELVVVQSVTVTVTAAFPRRPCPLHSGAISLSGRISAAHPG
jgi:hypothetical protein